MSVCVRACIIVVGSWMTQLHWWVMLSLLECLMISVLDRMLTSVSSPRRNASTSDLRNKLLSRAKGTT